MASLHLTIAGATAAALICVTAAEAGAQQHGSPAGPGFTLSRDGGQFGGRWSRHRRDGNFHRGHFNSFWLVEREPTVIIEREVVREVPVVVEPPPPPPPPRKPYVIGQSYASLPGGCMKMIEAGASYYWCSGEEWYQLVGTKYRAVAAP